ncbi:MAG: SPOR domain-containing protein [Trueperaceae bacterium]|nr:SPOR domain-containing protein [Trueperaceae bacterium]
MDWVRRNWPDLLIGVALVAVIAGIVATLLTGGSFFPLQTRGSTGQDGAGGTPQASAPQAEPEQDAGSSEDGPGVAVLPPSDEGEEDADDPPPGAPDPSVEESDAATDDEEGGEASSGQAIEPLAAGEEDAEDAPPEGDASAAPAEDAAEQAEAGGEEAPQDPQPDPSPAPEADGEVPTDPYRVSVGAFGSEANAQNQAERFRSDGFPVFIGRQGALWLVLVGPYEEESDAQAAAQRIRAGEYDVDPVIYLFEPDGDAATQVQAAAEGDAQETAEEEAQDETPPAAPAAGEEGSVLQVGAYANGASAEPFEARLSTLGFAPRRIEEGGLIKVVVGPFSGQALSDARVLLDGADIEYFAR